MNNHVSSKVLHALDDSKYRLCVQLGARMDRMFEYNIYSIFTDKMSMTLMYVIKQSYY